MIRDTSQENFGNTELIKAAIDGDRDAIIRWIHQLG